MKPWFQPEEAARLIEAYEDALERISYLSLISGPKGAFDPINLHEIAEDALAEMRQAEGAR